MEHINCTVTSQLINAFDFATQIIQCVSDLVEQLENGSLLTQPTSYIPRPELAAKADYHGFRFT